MVGEQDTLTISYASEGTLKQELHSGTPVISTDLDLDMLWYPGKRDLTDKIDSVDVYVTTPPDQYVAGNGTLEGIEEADGKWIHHWRHRHPVATTYLLELAITNYTIVKDSVLLGDGTMLPIYHYLYPESVAALSVNSRRPLTSCSFLKTTLVRILLRMKNMDMHSIPPVVPLKCKR